MAKEHKEPLFVQAIDFVSLAQKGTGAPYQTHLALYNGYAIAFDGILAAGHPTGQDITACPHTMTLVQALRKSKTTLSVTQMDAARLAIKSGRFRAFVDCLPGATMPGITPDPRAGALDNRIREGMTRLAPFIAENSQRVVMASCLLRSGSMLGTNGQVMLEYWHGTDLPPGLIVPKTFMVAVGKIDKNITGFGFSATSFTIYFEDDSWLRTQLYKETWPDMDKFLNVTSAQRPLPDKFFEGVGDLMPFAEDNKMIVNYDKLTTHGIDGKGADYDLNPQQGALGRVTFNAKHLQLLDGYINTIDFVGVNNISYFFGANLRGCICQHT